MTPTPWLDDTQEVAWVRFAAVLELLPRALDAQLERDEQLTHFDYYSLAMLSEAPERTLRMTALASMTNATLPRLSRVMNRLSDAGYAKVVQSAPGHIRNVRRLVVDALSDEQLDQLSAISARLLTVLDPDDRVYASVLH